MKTLLLQSDVGVVLETVLQTESPFARMRGLLGRRGLPAGHAMWFRPCRSIHTCFMQFCIDVIFLDKDKVVTDVRIGVKPWRVVIGAPGSYSVLEVQTGWLDDASLAIGTQFY
ncbi:MAG: DUF192 domain-containing protein [Kiritimatiellia bacterium]